MKIDITKLSEGRLNYMKKRAAKLGITLEQYVELKNAPKEAIEGAIALCDIQEELDKQGDGMKVKPVIANRKTPVIKFYDPNDHVKMGGMMTTFPEGYTKAPDLYVVNAMVYKPRKMMPSWTAMTNQGLVYITNVRQGMPRGNEQMIEIQVGTKYSQNTWMIQASVVCESDLTELQHNELVAQLIKSIPKQYQKHFVLKGCISKNGKAPSQLGYVGLEVA